MLAQNVIPMEGLEALRISQDRGAACHSVSALGSSIGTAILCSEGAAMMVVTVVGRGCSLCRYGEATLLPN